MVETAVVVTAVAKVVVVTEEAAMAVALGVGMVAKAVVTVATVAWDILRM